MNPISIAGSDAVGAGGDAYPVDPGGICGSSADAAGWMMSLGWKPVCHLAGSLLRMPMLATMLTFGFE